MDNFNEFADLEREIAKTLIGGMTDCAHVIVNHISVTVSTWAVAIILSITVCTILLALLVGSKK